MKIFSVFLLLSFCVCSIRKYCLYFKMANLHSKKLKKYLRFMKKKFGRIDGPMLVIVNLFTGNRMASAAWWYFFSKFTEFFDTFFFLARKKFDNVSTLHVIHHGIMPFFAWQACRFVPGKFEWIWAHAYILSRYIKVMVEHYLLFMFSPPKIS